LLLLLMLASAAALGECGCIPPPVVLAYGADAGRRGVVDAPRPGVCGCRTPPRGVAAYPPPWGEEGDGDAGRWAGSAGLGPIRALGKGGEGGKGEDGEGGERAPGPWTASSTASRDAARFLGEVRGDAVLRNPASSTSLGVPGVLHIVPFRPDASATDGDATAATPSPATPPPPDSAAAAVAAAAPRAVGVRPPSGVVTDVDGATWAAAGPSGDPSACAGPPRGVVLGENCPPPPSPSGIVSMSL
jgi:hypothetical protein